MVENYSFKIIAQLSCIPNAWIYAHEAVEDGNLVMILMMLILIVKRDSNGKASRKRERSTNSERTLQCLQLFLLNQLLSTMVVMQIMISLLLQLLDPLRNCRGKIGRLAMEVEFNQQYKELKRSRGFSKRLATICLSCS
ncbi:hypothetical protein SLA2020_250350 [Shorea laevis]